MKTFRGLNKTEKVPFPKPKIRPMDSTTFPGSAPDNGKLKSESNEQKPKPEEPKKEEPVKLDNTIKGLKRRMKNSQGLMFLKPQAEAYDGGAPNPNNSNYAQHLPVPANSKKTNMNKKLRRDTIPNASTTYESDVIMALPDLDAIFEAYINEELKVGEKEDDVDVKKFRGTNAKGPGTGKVARKYLGKQRGTTATGKPAHRIITEPVIGEKDKNWNKTTPSGERKK